MLFEGRVIRRGLSLMLNFLGRWVSHQLIPVSFWKWHAHCFFVCFFALWRGELFMENWIKMRRTTCKDLWKVCSIQKVIFHCIYVTHILYLFFYWWAFRLLQCPGCCTVVTSAAMNIAGTLLNSWWCLNWKEVQKGGDICVCVSVCVYIYIYVYISIYIWFILFFAVE